jgi:hypothetical protein
METKILTDDSWEANYFCEQNIVHRHIFLCLLQLHSPVVLCTLPLYIPDEMEAMNPRIYAQRVCEIMSLYLDVPVSHLNKHHKTAYHRCFSN